jgi:hypothetical protein
MDAIDKYIDVCSLPSQATVELCTPLLILKGLLKEEEHGNHMYR